MHSRLWLDYSSILGATRGSFMKSISKHIGRIFVLTAALLAGCSEAGLNEPLQKAASGPTTDKTPATAQPQSQPVQIGGVYETDMSALRARPEILAAFKTIEAHREENNQDMIELNEIPAPPFGEEVRGRRVAQMFREAGLADVKIDAAGNVIGRRPGRSGAKTIAIGAHIDTVFPIETDVTVKREGDTYIAPGIGDNLSLIHI